MPKAHNYSSYHTASQARSPQTSIPFPHLALILLIGASFLSMFFQHYSLFGVSPAYTVTGQPSITRDFINRVLAHYHSPAEGKGKALYDDGVKYGVDPAYALAFFMHESLFGTQGVAVVTHSLGNIRATQNYPQYQGYRLYANWEDGFEDWYQLIATLYVKQWSLSTVDQIIPVYAPSADSNDDGAYIHDVKTAVDTWRHGLVDV